MTTDPQSLFLKQENFENQVNRLYPKSERIRLFTLRLVLTHQNISKSIWSELGVITPKRYKMPSTHIGHNELLKARNRQVLKGKRIGFEVVYSEGEENLALEIVKEAINLELVSWKAELYELEKTFLFSEMISGENHDQ